LKARGYDKATRALDSIERCLSAHAEPPLVDRSVESYPIRTLSWQNGLCHLSRNDNP
jgi:hypothetical protein